MVVTVEKPAVLRMRRLRKSTNMRLIMQQVQVLPQDLVLPLFICPGRGVETPIVSMPGCSQISVDRLPYVLDQMQGLALKAVILFGIPEYKDIHGSAALADDGIIQQAIIAIKAHAPDIIVIADLCMCEYTSHGHCGILDAQNMVDNDQTLEYLAKQACSLAAAGVDIIAPSGMMDFMVAAVRRALDDQNFLHVAILSYAIKYASHCYGPFREAAAGGMQFGDRKSYQMDYQNISQAYVEAALDMQEGADMLMIKPAQYYLDIICRIKLQHPEIILAAYQVSGEYSMIMAAAQAGYLSADDLMHESLVAIKRAGADIIISYFALKYAKWWKDQYASS